MRSRRTVAFVAPVLLALVVTVLRIPAGSAATTLTVIAAVAAGTAHISWPRPVIPTPAAETVGKDGFREHRS